jgi:AraC-like DNA-binding protein
MGPLPAAYTEWAAPAALRPAVACLWASVGQDGRETLVLPDACTDLIWEQGKGAYVAGPDTGPVPAQQVPGTVIFGIRFPPASGGPVLGVPLSELRDQRVDLSELRPADARRLPGTLDPATAVARMVDLAGALVTDNPPDLDVAHAASLLRDPRARVEDVAEGVGLSMRQLRRRCDAAVGYGPKTLQRILRFRRFVSWIDAGPAGDYELATVAADLGYADQAHLTRECARMAGLTPAALIKARGAG